MRALVIVASKYGATKEIGEAIAATLDDRGIGTQVRAPDDVDALDGVDAVVLGSAVYVGRWLKPARDLVDRLGAALAERPVWLFSSGPIGDPPRPEDDPVDVSAIIEATRARDHRVFPGKLDRARLSFPERALVTALRAPEGDFRDWDAVSSWARDIAEALHHDRG